MTAKLEVEAAVVVTPAEARARRAAGEPVALIDVRTPVEFREVHAEGATNVPVSELTSERIGRVAAEAHGAPIHLICKSGALARQAAAKFAEMGVATFLIEGGTDAWVQARLPVVRGNVGLPLMRQVQLVIGVMNLAFAGLALAVSPWFALGNVFIGFGLVLAGATGWCGLAFALAALPWNRGSDPMTCTRG